MRRRIRGGRGKLNHEIHEKTQQEQIFLAEAQRPQSIFFLFKNSAFSTPLRGRLSLDEPRSFSLSQSV